MNLCLFTDFRVRRVSRRQGRAQTWLLRQLDCLLARYLGLFCLSKSSVKLTVSCTNCELKSLYLRVSVKMSVLTRVCILAYSVPVLLAFLFLHLLLFIFLTGTFSPIRCLVYMDKVDGYSVFILAKHT